MQAGSPAGFQQQAPPPPLGTWPGAPHQAPYQPFGGPGAAGGSGPGGAAPNGWPGAAAPTPQQAWGSTAPGGSFRSAPGPGLQQQQQQPTPQQNGGLGGYGGPTAWAPGAGRRSTPGAPGSAPGTMTCADLVCQNWAYHLLSTRVPRKAWCLHMCPSARCRREMQAQILPEPSATTTGMPTCVCCTIKRDACTLCRRLWRAAAWGPAGAAAAAVPPGPDWRPPQPGRRRAQPVGAAAAAPEHKRRAAAAPAAVRAAGGGPPWSLWFRRLQGSLRAPTSSYSTCPHISTSCCYKNKTKILHRYTCHWQLSTAPVSV